MSIQVSAPSANPIVISDTEASTITLTETTGVNITSSVLTMAVDGTGASAVISGTGDTTWTLWAYGNIRFEGGTSSPTVLGTGANLLSAASRGGTGQWKVSANHKVAAIWMMEWSHVTGTSFSEVTYEGMTDFTTWLEFYFDTKISGSNVNPDDNDVVLLNFYWRNFS